jgi:hypothetical protein
MKSEISDIIPILETALKPFIDHEINYEEFESSDNAHLFKLGFNDKSAANGTYFIDELRTFFDDNNEMIDYDTSLWIVNSWGKIGTFQKNETNQNRIKKLRDALKNESLTRHLFDVISSLSKIASFMDYEEYFVYDSRAIYTLNWLIFKNNIPNPKFFPMPASRTKNLITFDLDTIINLFYKEKIQDKALRKDLFFDHKHAYFIYCDLIKELNKILFPKQKPYYLEMLLYTIAEPEIFNELKSSVQLTIL